MGGIRKFLVCLSTLAIVGALQFAVPSASANDVFKTLDGSWRGSGVVRLQGSNEAVSCRGYYNAKAGSALSIAIRCASTSYRIEMRSNIVNNDGRLSGKWEERTFNAEGALSGRLSGSMINLTISGVINGSLSISLAGASHQVNLTASGPRFKGVSINMKRG